jgi:hypothetical protein
MSSSAIMVADPFAAVVMTGSDHIPLADAMWAHRDAYKRFRFRLFSVGEDTGHVADNDGGDPRNTSIRGVLRRKTAHLVRIDRSGWRATF